MYLYFQEVSVSERNIWGDLLSDDSLSDEIPLPKYGYVNRKFQRLIASFQKL